MPESNKKNHFLNSRKGQVGLILILAIAFALIFYAASMNLGRISETKTQTQIAAMAGASQLGSQMASYGQYLFQTQLGGRKKICAPSGVLLAIIVVVLVIIIIILAIYSCGGVATVIATYGIGALYAAAAIVLVAVANVVIQAAVIQPAITAMWNKMIQDTMGISDQYSEYGILQGLHNIVTDNKQVPDLYDFDNDYYWGFNADGKAVDRVNRFAYYYTKQRMEDMEKPQMEAIRRFMNQLRDYVYQTPLMPYGDPNESPKWGLYDPVNCLKTPDNECCYDPTVDPDGDGVPGKKIPSTCNPCCVSDHIDNPLQDKDPRTHDEFVSAVPSCCDCWKPDGSGCPIEKQCGTRAFCSEMSPYGNAYPYVYQKYFENPENNFSRKRVLLDPVEDLTKLALDGKKLMPDPARKLRTKKFENACTPPDLTEPPNPPVLPGDEIIQKNLENPRNYFNPTRLCPSGFTPTPEVALAPFTMYPGKCIGPIKTSTVKRQDATYKCEGIDPPAALPGQPAPFVSFREALGTDDESINFVKDPDDPNRAQSSVDDIGDEKYRKFNIFDTTGYYTEPDYKDADFNPARTPDQKDKKKGIFPFFYKIADWGLDLSQLEELGDFTKYPEHCFWYDDRDAAHKCVDTGKLYEQQPKGLLPQLHLPLDPNDPAPPPGSELVFNITNHVDGVSVPNHPALRPDKVTLPSKRWPAPGYGEIIAADEYCAQEMSPLTPLALPINGFWKRGGDRYCQPPAPDDNKIWPYFAHCDKHRWTRPFTKDTAFCHEEVHFEDVDGDGNTTPEEQDEETPIDCYCGKLVPSLTGPEAMQFPDDILDNFAYGINDFLDVTRGLFRQWESQPVRMAVNFKLWYPDIAEWIEPQGTSDNKERPGQPCYICDGEVEGELWTAYKAIKEIRTRLEHWRDDPYWGDKDDDVWCLPQNSNGLVQLDEIQAFNSALGIQGVINCLVHNLTNDKRFKACEEGCENAERMAKADSTDPEFIEYHRGDKVNFPGASAEGYRQVVFGQLCKPYLPRSLILQPADPVAGTPEGYFNPNTFEQPNPIRLQQLLDCEFKTCPDNFKKCNSARCNAEKICQNTYDLVDLPACRTGEDETVCLAECNTCFLACEHDSTTLSTLCTPASHHNYPGRSCDQIKSDYITSFCDPKLNESSVGQCAWVCEQQRKTCCGATLPCPANCQTTKDFCMNGPSGCQAAFDSCKNVLAENQYISCQTRCNSVAVGSYFYNCNKDCLDHTDLAPSRPCLLKIAEKKADCYYEAKTNWEACKVDPLKSLCGSLPRQYDCKTEIGVDIDEYWTATGAGLGCVYPAQRVDFSPDTRPGFGVPPLLGDVHYLPTSDPVDLLDTTQPIPDFINGPDGVEAQKGSCKDTNLLNLLKKSIPEATNQAAKFQTRIDFLTNRLSEVNENITILREAEIEFKQFLEGAARELIAERKRFDTIETGLPYHVIYGWMGPPAESRALFAPGEGYWHVVKVEGRTPDKCDNDCGAPGNGSENTDPGWPRVKTYTKSAGTERCYALTNTNGIVKFRVTRWDQEKDPSLNNAKFPTGQRIWDFRMFNPLRGRGDVNNLLINCTGPAGAAIKGPVDHLDVYEGAFLLNRPRNNPNCWQAANEILTTGASTTLCAQYYFHMGNPKGMSHQFIKCPSDRF